MNGPHVPGWGFAVMALTLARMRNGCRRGRATILAPRDQCERHPHAYPVSREFHSITDAAGGHLGGMVRIYGRPGGRWYPGRIKL